MKKLFFVMFIILMSMFLLSGCMGDDGDDGRAYLSFDWDYYVDNYWDNNPNVPSSITRNRDYNVRAGTYNFTYDCSDGYGSYWSYNGTYRITVDRGASGEAFGVDGADGDDKYFNLYLSGQGAWFAKPLSNEKPEKETLSKEQTNSSSYNRVKIGEPEEFVYRSSDGLGKLVMTRQCYIWVKK